MIKICSRRVQCFTESLNGSKSLVCRVSEPEKRFHFCWKRSTKVTPKKTEDADHQDLIRWSIQEVRRIANRLAQCQIQLAYIITWSCWRRAHQAAARRAHIKNKNATVVIVSALKELLTDESFVNLVRVEGLVSMPKAISMRISGEKND